MTYNADKMPSLSKIFNSKSLPVKGFDNEGEAFPDDEGMKFGLDRYEQISTGMREVLYEYVRNKMSKPNNADSPFRVVSVIHNKHLNHTISLPVWDISETFVIMSYEDIQFLLKLESYMDDGNLICNLQLDSGENKLPVEGLKLKELLISEALSESSLKGGYVIMQDGRFAWEKGSLDEVTFDDIMLPENLLSQCKYYSELYYSKGVMGRFMLCGIPGSGKTEITRILSSTLNRDKGVTIIKANPCDFLKKKVELAKALAPSLIIMDDVDLYLGNRNKGGFNPNLLGKFLDVLDGVDKLPDDVGLIASTNAPHLIDMAAQRPGRFNKILFFGELTRENIVGIIKKSLNSFNSKFGGVTDEDFEVLTSDNMVKFFKSTNKPGAYVFETTIELMHKKAIGGDFDLDTLIKNLEEDNKKLKENLNVSSIKSEYSDGNKRLGFQ